MHEMQDLTIARFNNCYIQFYLTVCLNNFFYVFHISEFFSYPNKNILVCTKGFGLNFPFTTLAIQSVGSLHLLLLNVNGTCPFACIAKH